MCLIPVLYYLYRIIVRGYFQILFCLLSSAALVPLRGAILFFAGWIYRILRVSYDYMMRLLLKKVGRIPASDSFLARRIQGPGLMSQWYFQASNDLILLSLHLYMEKETLTRYKNQIYRKIDEPLNNYENLISRVLGPMGVQLDRKQSVAVALLANNDRLKKELSQILENHPVYKDDFLKNVPTNIRLKAAALSEAIQKGSNIVSHYYPKSIFRYMTEWEIDHFWYSKQLSPNDWVGLTRSIYSELFSPNFLISLEDSDEVYSLKIKQLNLERYLNMFVENQPHDDLDFATLIEQQFLAKKISSKLTSYSVRSNFNCQSVSSGISFTNKFLRDLQKQT